MPDRYERSDMAPYTPLRSPFEYFRDSRHDPLLAGLGVFIAYVIAQIAAVISLFYALVDQVANAPPEFDRAVDPLTSDVLLSTVVLLALSMSIGLFVVAAVMHYPSRTPRAAGTFEDAIAVASWAYAPNLLLDLPLTYLHARYVIEQRTFDGSDPQTLQREFEALQFDGGGAIPLFLLAVTIAWSVYILANGIAATHEIDASDALRPAAIVGIGAFLFGIL